MSRRLYAVLFLIAACILVALAGCMTKAKVVPYEPKFGGQRLVVWDADEPRVSGAPPYRDLVMEVIEEFSSRYSVQVDLRVVTRQEITDFLSGKTGSAGSEEPGLTFSTEWPLFSGLEVDVSQSVGESEYLGFARNYWQSGDKILAIPSYIHWVSTAARVDKVGPLVYMPGSPGFLRAVLDLPGGGWDVDRITAFLLWVKERYGPVHPDPLGAWRSAEAAAVYPATPFLFRWLEGEDTEETVPVPVENPFGEPRFFVTVPAYLVLAEAGPKRECAVLLGKLMAANLGRWTARAVGGIPALLGDIAVFNVESSFGYKERSQLLSLLSANHGSAGQRAPDRRDFILRESLEKALAGTVIGFLSGETDEPELRAIIHEVLERHTKP